MVVMTQKQKEMSEKEIMKTMFVILFLLLEYAAFIDIVFEKILYNHSEKRKLFIKK